MRKLPVYHHRDASFKWAHYAAIGAVLATLVAAALLWPDFGLLMLVLIR